MRCFYTFLFIISFVLAGFAQSSQSVVAGNDASVLESRYEGTSIKYTPIVSDVDSYSSISYTWKSIVEGVTTDLGSSASLEYNIPMIGETTGKLVDIFVDIKGEPKKSSVLPLDTTIHYVLYVYAKSNIEPSDYHSVLYVGDEVTLSFTQTGGKDGAWSYKWDSGVTTETYTFKPEKAGEHKVSVVVKNTLGNSDTQYDFSDTLVYTIKVWDKCSVKSGDLKVYRYSTQSVTFSPEVLGGDLIKWAYNWEVDGVSVSTSSSYTMQALSSPGETHIKLTLSNTPEGIKKEYNTEINYTLYSYTYPAAKENSYHSVLYVDDEVTLSFTETGGKDGAWSYNWSSGATTKNCSFKPTQAGEQKVTVVVKNTLGNSDTQYDFSDTLVYTIKVWDKCSVKSGDLKVYRYSTQSVTFSPEVLGGDLIKWAYNWEVDGVSVSTSSSYTMQALSSPGETHIKLTLSNTPEGIKKEYNTEINYTLYSYTYPAAKENSYHSVLYVDDEVTLSFTETGGKDGAWSYNWSSGATTKNCSFKPTQAGDQKVTVVVKNTLGNSDAQYDFSDTLVYTIKVWDKCSVSIEEPQGGFNGYEKDTCTYTPTISGGDSDKWTYEWYVDNVKVSDELSCSIPTPNVGSAENVILAVKLKVTNTPDGIYKPFVDFLQFNLTIWPHGGVEKLDVERIYYHGDNVTLAVKPRKGFPGGWLYQWTKQGDSKLLSFTESATVKVSNTSDRKQIVTYQVEWRNIIGNQIGSKGVDTINIEVYPEVKAPTFGYEGAVQMRDVDLVTITATLGQGGNPDGWSYAWNGDASTTDYSYTINSPIESDVKEKTMTTVSLHWVNKGPNGKIWEEGDLEQNIVVYNTPTAPELKLKGDGTSNIYIVDGMGMTEDELWENGYAFRFWDGDTFLAEVDDQRWYRFEDKLDNAMVQSVWYYDDDFVCTSDLVKVSSVQYVSSQKTEVSIYRINGDLVRRYTLEGEYTLNDICSELTSGFYIVHCVSDGVSNVNKIVIK